MSTQHDATRTAAVTPAMTSDKWARAVYRAVAIFVHNVYTVFPYLMWMLLLRPLLYLSPDVYWDIEGVLFSWILTIVGYWPFSAGYTGKGRLSLMSKFPTCRVYKDGHVKCGQLILQYVSLAWTLAATAIKRLCCWSTISLQPMCQRSCTRCRTITKSVHPLCKYNST